MISPVVFCLEYGIINEDCIQNINFKNQNIFYLENQGE